jgi:hypothetical protein
MLLVKLRAWALPALALLLAACGTAGAAQNQNPAAVVNGHAIPMEAYTAAFHQERAQEVGTTGYDVCTIKSLASACGLIKQRSLNDVIDAELVREYAAHHNISVSASEDSSRWLASFRTRFDGRKDVEHTWLKRVGISEADLRRSLHNDWLAQKVLYAVTAGLSQYQPSINVAQIEAVTKADYKTIQGQLRRGLPFLTVAALAARNKTAGCTSAPCGDLGWTADAFVPSSRSSLLTARIGSVIGPIQEPGDWIWFVVEGRNPHLQLTNKQLYALRQLKFVAWLERQQKLAKVTRNVAV